MQGFTRTIVLGGVARDVQAATPTALITNMEATSAALRAGTSITADGTPHTKAATYTTLIASTAVAAYGMWVLLGDSNNTGQERAVLVDIAKGAAVSEINLINNINGGEATLWAAAATATCGKLFYFPGLTIPLGTRISARSQASTGSQTTNVGIWLDTRIQFQVGNSAYVTYGADTATSRGTSVPSGANALGAWTNIGTTSASHNLWVIGLDALGDTSLASEQFFIEVGYGPNAGSITTMVSGLICSTDATERIASAIPPFFGFVLTSGNLVWVRMASNGGETRGVILYGV